MVAADSNSTLTILPDELLLKILSHLDIPDLLPLTRTSHHLRTLSHDPLLHTTRLHHASLVLSRYIPSRPSRAELMHQHIYITRTTLAARSLGRNLIKIKLNRQLRRRPSIETLVEKGVLPRECYYTGSDGRGRKGLMVAPGLIETKRRVEKERVKDLLRRWVEDWGRRGSENREGDESAPEHYVRPDVRRMARRFTMFGERETQRECRWGRLAGERKKELPTRAKVLGLRRFWEKVGRGD